MQNATQNAAKIAENTELINHLKDIGLIYGFPAIIVIGLLVWAWKRMESAQDKLEQIFIATTKENDEVHDSLFKLVRATDEKLNTLKGAHDAIQSGGVK